MLQQCTRVACVSVCCVVVIPGPVTTSSTLPVSQSTQLHLHVFQKLSKDQRSCGNIGLVLVLRGKEHHLWEGVAHYYTCFNVFSDHVCVCVQESAVTVCVRRAAGVQTAPTSAPVRTAAPAPRRTAPVRVLPATVAPTAGVVNTHTHTSTRTSLHVDEEEQGAGLVGRLSEIVWNKKIKFHKNNGEAFQRHIAALQKKKVSPNYVKVSRFYYFQVSTWTCHFGMFTFLFDFHFHIFISSFPHYLMLAYWMETKQGIGEAIRFKFG